MDFLLKMILKTLIETINFTGVIILTGLLLGLLRNCSIRNFQRSLGNGSIMLTGFIGVPLHELSHAIAALVFGHSITAIKLLQKPDDNGVMGYVEHSYNEESIYQQIGNFFIGIAPIIGGITVVILLMKGMLPKTYDTYISIIVKNIHVENVDKTTIISGLDSYVKLLKSIFSAENFKNIRFYMFLFISICICSHIALSKADIKGAAGGLVIIFVAFFLLNVFGLVKYISSVSILKYNIVITGFLTIAVIFSVVTFLTSLLLVSLKEMRCKM